MNILLFLLPIFLIGGMVYLLLITLRAAVKLQGTEQVAWVCLIILLFPLGSIIFLLADPNSKTTTSISGKTKGKSTKAGHKSDPTLKVLKVVMIVAVSGFVVMMLGGLAYILAT